uniref:Uncharacterized protein n=1 Tax=Entamoeba histolytica TaxID=5759 RepID=S0AX41_ENTHI|nr:hypothetical protein [Entamoeba histolytica]
MNAFILLFIALATAEDIYSPFKRSCVIQNRINTITAQTKAIHNKIRADEQQERNLNNSLYYLYRDLKYATVAEDRARLELEIEAIQKKLHSVRIHKVNMLRDIRKETDKITAPFRDSIARSNKIERHVGLEDEGNFVDERLKTQATIKKVTSQLANKYATLAAKIAAQSDVAKAAKKFNNDAAKVQAFVAKKAEAAYTKVHSKIVKAISAAVENGVARNNVETVAKTAIEQIVDKLMMKVAAQPSVEAADKVAQNIVKSQLKQIKKAVKVTPKKVVKKPVKKAVAKKVVKKAAPKPAAKKIAKK